VEAIANTEKHLARLLSDLSSEIGAVALREVLEQLRAPIDRQAIGIKDRNLKRSATPVALPARWRRGTARKQIRHGGHQHDSDDGEQDLGSLG